MTCTVRVITCVRTSTGGVLAASVAAVGVSAGRNVNAASPPAATAVIAAAVRVWLLRM